MRRTVILLLAMALVLGLAGCKGNEPSPSSKRPDMDALRKANVGSYVFFGEYEQDNNEDTGKEAIEWLVLAKEEDRLLLISRYALDCKPFNMEKKDNTWAFCSLREWLNGSFYENAFTPEEKDVILETVITEDETAGHGYRSLDIVLVTPEASNPLEADPSVAVDVDPGFDKLEEFDFTDKVFLLSSDEAEQYFNDDDSRMCPGTPYCYAQGTWEESSGNCIWWLRSSGRYTNYAMFVSFDGRNDWFGGAVDNGEKAVRPAVWINIGDGK